MRVVIIGATGTIGQAVAQAIADRHEVIPVARTRGQYQVDLASKESIQRLFEVVGSFDALISTAGQARFGPLEALSDEDFQLSLSNKLMGQVNLVRTGVRHISDNGSFTLTSGVLASEPMPGSAAISLVNAGLEGLLERPPWMTRGLRVNVVSPPWVSETLAAMGQDSSSGMPAVEVAAAYVKSLEGGETGKVLDARAFAS